MSNSVDRRVVEMEFDNQQFEKRVATTRESLKGLKKDLNFDETSKNLASLEKAANSLDMSGVTAGLENISSKFTAMGVIGFTVLQNLTNDVINFGKKIADSTFGQMMSGGKTRALNLEQAQFQISGLGVDWKKQTESGVSLYEQIDKAVSGTAYGLDAAAKVAGQLLASNIDAGTDKMQNALSGISGVAAMTNSTYEEIGHIFTTIAGNGRVMTEQLNQFAGRGLNVAATLADHLHVTEAELRDMVSKGKVDFNTFAEAMNEAFGEQATKANDTYTGSLSNVRAALSRIGAEFQMPYLENMRQTFVALIPVLNSVKTSLGPMFEIATSGMEFFRKEIVNTLSKFAVFDEKGKTVSKDMNKFAEVVKNFVETLKAKDLTGRSVFDYLKVSYNAVKSIFGSLAKIVGDVVGPIKDAFTEMFPIHRIMQSLSNGLIAIKNFFSKFEAAIKSATTNGDSLKRVTSGIFAAFGLLVSVGKVLTKILGGLAIAAGKVLGWFLNLIAPIGDLIKNMHDFFIRTNGATNSIKPLADAFKKLGFTLYSLIGTFQRAFTLAFAPFKRAMQENGKQTESFASIATNAISKFASFFGDKISKLNDWLLAHRESIGKFGQTIGTVFGKIGVFFASAWKAISSFFGEFSEGFKKFRDSIAGTISSFGSIKTDGVTTLVGKFKASTGPLEAMGRFFASLWELLKSIFTKIGPILGSLVRLLFDGFSSIATVIKDGVDNLQPVNGASVLAGGGVVALLITFMKKVRGVFDRIESFDPIKTAKKISSLFDALIGYVKQLKKAKAAEALKDFATAVLEIAVAILILATIEPERLVSALGAISALIWEMTKVFEVLSAGSNKLKFWEKSDIGDIGAVLVEMATAVLILASAIRILADLDAGQVFKGTLAISALLWELVAIVKVLSKGNKEMTKGASALIFMAIAVKILVKAVVALSSLSWEELAKGLVGTIALMLALAAAVKLMSKAKGIIKAALGMVLIAAALRILVPVVKELGSMDWQDLAKAGIAIAGLLTMLTLFSKFSKGGSMITNAVGLVVIATSMKIFVSVIKEFEVINWGTLAKAGVTILALLAALTLFSRLCKGSTLIASAIGMTIVATSLLIFSASIKTFAGMKWEELGKAGVAIGGLLTMIVLFSRLCKPASLIANAVAMTILGVAMLEFAAVMVIFGSMSWNNLAKGLVAIAAAFIIMGVAAKALKPMVKTILALSVAMALFGVGLALVGVGLVAISAGISGLLSSLMLLAKAFQFILVTILESIPMIFKIIGAAIVAFLGVIRDAAPALGAALKAVVISALDAIIAIAPKLGETICVLLDTFLPILVQYTPKIVDGIVSILIGVINALADRVPELVYAVANFLKKLMGAITEVAGSTITEDSMKGVILGLAAIAVCIYIISKAAKQAQKAIVGMVAIAAVMVLMSAMFLVLSSLDPNAFIKIATGLSEAMLAISASMFIISKVPVMGAVYGIAGFAIVVAGLAAILAALGGLAQIDGFSWLLEEGSKVLAQIGKAIGDFIGNIIGGIFGGIANSLPGIADSLSDFMNRLQPFIDGAKKIDDDVMSGVLKLVEVILLMTVADFINGIASFITGGVDFADFGRQLSEFAPYMVDFANTVAGVDTEALKSAADAALALAQFAQAIPNSGGLAGFFAGENNLEDWAPQLKPFGEALAEFSAAVDGNVNAEAVKNAAEAGKAIAEMADKVPNEGGVAGFFAGENSLSIFGPEMADFGKYLAEFSSYVDGKVNSDAVKTAAEAGVLIAEMADKVPNEGGVAGFFAGENSLSVFGPEMADFGKYLAEFSSYVDGKINPEAVKAAAEAGKTLAEMADMVPNEGGVVSWFAGDNSLAKFGPEMADFGKYLKQFSENIGDDFNSSGVKAAAEAGKTIAEMANIIPNEGGIASWFAGDNSLAQFGPEMADFGYYLAEFSKNLGDDFKPTAVKAAAEAAKSIAEMANVVPNEGGVAAWFAGDNGLAKFGTEMASLGFSLALFSASVDGKVNAIAVRNATESGRLIAEMADKVPNEGGVAGFFAGENSLANFGTEISVFGASLAIFSAAVDGKVNLEAVKTATEAGKTIATMVDIVPNEGGITGFFAGEKSLAKFGSEMATFGLSLALFSLAVDGKVNADSIKIAVNAASSIVDLTNKLPNEGGIVSWFAGDNSLAKFGPEMIQFGYSIRGFSDSLEGVNILNLVSAISGISMLINIATALDGMNATGLTEFAKGLTALGNASVTNFIKAFENSAPRAFAATLVFLNNILLGVKTSQSVIVLGLELIAAAMIKDILNKINEFVRDFKMKGEEIGKTFGEGLNNRKTYIFTILKNILRDMTSTVYNYETDFYNSGMRLVEGLGNGVRNNRYVAINAVIDVANAMLTATRNTLDIHSPSREGEDAGRFYDLGIAKGVLRYAYVMNNAAQESSQGVIDTTWDMLSSLSQMNLSDIDVTPTIRPVMDLSEVSNSIRNISGLMQNTQTYSIGTAISSDRARLNKEEMTITVETTNTDVVKAVGELRKEMSAMKDAMSKYKIYLDKKTLVGELVDDMDTALGRKAEVARKAGR